MEPSFLIQTLFVGDSQVRSLLRSHDWFSFPGGPPEQWSAEIVRTIQMVLDSESPMSFLWGPDQYYFYNDAYIELIGTKHPSALARPFWESWSEVVEVFSPILAEVTQGKFCSLEHMGFPVIRHGALEKAYFTYLLLPIFKDGSVIGIFNPAMETTAQVLASRRQQFLQGAELLLRRWTSILRIAS